MEKKIGDNLSIERKKLNANEESKVNQLRTKKWQRRRRKQNTEKGEKKRNNDTHECNIVMTSSNVLDLNAYKYQCSNPDLVKREIWGMRKLYVPNGSRKLNAVNRIHICVCVCM